MTNKDAVKAGLYTALWTFIALFGLSLTEWLNDLTAAASADNGELVFYGDPTVLVKAAVSAAAAAASGLVGTIVRLAQVATGKGEGVHYDHG